MSKNLHTRSTCPLISSFLLPALFACKREYWGFLFCITFGIVFSLYQGTGYFSFSSLFIFFWLNMIPILVLSECAPSASSFYIVRNVVRPNYFQRSLALSGFVCLSCNSKAMYRMKCLNCSFCTAGFYRNLEYYDDFCQPCPAGKSQKRFQLWLLKHCCLTYKELISQPLREKRR